MGLIKILSKPKESPSVLRLPSGSFTVNAEGKVIASTLPSSFSEALRGQLADAVLTTFRQAATQHTPLTEISIEYPGLRLSARELRGGAIIFLAPKALSGR